MLMEQTMPARPMWLADILAGGTVADVPRVVQEG